MSDCRNALIQSIRESLSTVLDVQTTEIVTQKIIILLGDYDVTKKSTDLVVYDDSNHKLLKRYSACMYVDGKSKKTIYQYQKALNHFLESVQKPVNEIGAYDIRYYLATKKESGVSDRTLENIRSYLSAFFQWLTEEELIQKNPCANIKPIKYADVQRMAFSSVEIDALRHSCKTLKERAIVEMLISSGVRVSELCDLDISDIDFQNMAVHVRHGKGDKERITYINDVARVHLQKYVSQRYNISTSLFCNHNGERITTAGIRHILKNISNRANVKDVHPHRFRRTFATELAKRGMAVHEIQRLMGHTDISTTMGYVCVDDIKIKASYRQFIA